MAPGGNNMVAQDIDKHQRANQERRAEEHGNRWRKTANRWYITNRDGHQTALHGTIQTSARWRTEHGQHTFGGKGGQQ